MSVDFQLFCDSPELLAGLKRVAGDGLIVTTIASANVDAGWLTEDFGIAPRQGAFIQLMDSTPSSYADLVALVDRAKADADRLLLLCLGGGILKKTDGVVTMLDADEYAAIRLSARLAA